jgi:alcohol dehydrogenase class IV
MIAPFNHSSIPHIRFGTGTFDELPTLLQSYGNRIAIVTGNASFAAGEKASVFFRELERRSLAYRKIVIPGEPSPVQIDKATEDLRKWKPLVVVAIGGGSALDAGKAISAMLCEAGSIAGYLEGIGEKVPSGKKIPFIAVPTTSGTGSEATYNAVITSPGPEGYKKSLRHPNYVPNLALVDPSLTIDCPSGITAASGLDALTQLLEAFVSNKSNPLTDSIAFDGLTYVLRNIEKAVFNGKDIVAREAMSYGALLSGIALANAGLGVVHGFAQPLGSMFPIPHGIVCGNLMGPANRITVEKLHKDNKTVTLEKYTRVAKILFQDPNAERLIGQLLDHFDSLIERFQLPRLSVFGVSEENIPAIVAELGLKNHPVELGPAELESIVRNRL